MKRCVCACALLLMFAAPAWAGSSAGFGLFVDVMIPQDSEMYGSGMAGNTWGRDLLGLDSSVGHDRNQFYTWNRYDRLVTPGLDFFYAWTFGLGLHLRTQWIWLTWAPNEDVDILFDRVAVPIALVPTWSFNTGGKVRPNVFVGGGFAYVSTKISGADLFDQARNPNYNDEGLPEPDADSVDNYPDPRRYDTDKHTFGRSDWVPYGTAGVGLDVALSEQALLGFSLRYTTMPMTTIEVERVADGPDSWHWREKSKDGDAGGFGGAVSIHFTY